MKNTATRFSFISRLYCFSFSKILEDRGLGFVISYKYVFYSGNKYECNFASHKHTDIPLLPLNITHTFSIYSTYLIARNVPSININSLAI